MYKNKIHSASTYLAFIKASYVLMLLIFVFMFQKNEAQVLTNKGAVITIKEKTVVQAGDIENLEGAIENNGSIYLTGSWTNNAAFSDNTGTITFNGSLIQRILRLGGESFYNFEINNSGDSVILNNPLQVKGKTKVEKGQLATKYDIDFLGEVMCGNGSIQAWGGNINYPEPAQRIIAGTYYNLTLKGSSIKYLCGDVRVINKLSIESGSLELGKYNLIVDGYTEIAGNIIDSDSKGVNIFKGLVNLKVGSGWDFRGNGDVEFQKGILYNGNSFYSGKGLYRFTTNNQAVDGTKAMTLDCQVMVDKNVIFTNLLDALGTGLTLNNVINGVNNTAVLKNEGIISYQHFSEPMNNGSLDASAAGNIFRYSGTGQTMATGANGNYYDLVLTGSGSKLMNGNIHSSRNLTIENGCNLTFGSSAVFILQVDGNLLASGGNIDMQNGSGINHIMKLYGIYNTCANLYADDQSMIEYLGTNGQEVFPSQNYRNINFAGSGKKIIKGNLKASGNTIKIATNVDARSYEIYIASDLVAINRTAGAIIGKLKRRVERTSVDYLFPVGTDTSYNSLIINYARISKGDYLVEFLPSDPGNSGLPLNDDGVDIHDRFSNGYWKTQALNALASDLYSVSLNAEKFGIDVASRIIKKDGTQFTVNGKHGNLTGTTISRTNIIGISTVATIFAIGKGRPTIFIHAINDTICFGTQGEFKINAGGHAPLSYQWYRLGSAQKLTDNTKYSGTTTPILLVKNSTFADQLSFYCIVTDPAGHAVIGDTASLTVNKIPDVILSQLRDSICDNTFGFIAISPKVSDTVYTWQATPDPGIIGSSNGTGLFIKQLLKNNNLFDANVAYAVKATGPKPTYCQSPVITSTVIVKPTPRILALATNDTICYNEGASIQVNSLIKTTNTVRYHLKLESNGGISGLRSEGDYNLGSFSDNLVNTSQDTQYITYVFKPYIYNLKPNEHCENGIESRVLIKLNPRPTINVEAVADTIICFNEGVRIKTTKTNPTHIGKWLYDLKVSSSSKAVTGFTTSATGLSTDLVQLNLSNNSDSLQWIEYTFTPRIENPRPGLSNCEGGEVKKIKVYINPKPDVSILASEDTICYNQLVSFKVNRKNGKVLGTWNYQLSTSSTSPDVSGYTTTLIDENKNLINDPLINKSIEKQVVSYHFTPVIKNPRTSKAYCQAGHDTIINIHLNPKPSILINTKETLYCDSGSVDFDILSQNGAVMGEKYYMVQLEYDSSVVKPDRKINGYYPVGKTNHHLINLSDTIQKVVYKVKALIRNPKGDNPNDYCSSNESTYDASITFEVLPTLKAELIPYAYKGNWNVRCFGESNGSINLKLTGGMIQKGMTDKQAVYLWSNKATSKDIKNLKAGNYSVKVRDTKSCLAWSSIKLKEPNKLIVDAVVENQANCTSLKDGRIVATRSGGTLPYRTSWTSGTDTILRNDTIAKDLSLGEYYVHLTDANGCYTHDSVTFYNSGEIVVNFVTSEYTNGREIYGVSCVGSKDGFIEPDIYQESGIVYTFQWSKLVDGNLIHVPSTKNGLDRVGPGTYMLEVYNSADCYGNNTVELVEPKPANISATLSKGLLSEYQITCDNTSDGSIKLTTTGGYKNFSYKWSSSSPIINDTLAEINQLDSGTYYLTVKDRWYQYHNTGECLYYDTFSLRKPKPLTAEFELSKFDTVNVSCFDSKDGKIKVKLSGGVAPYTYKWKYEDEDQTLSNQTSSVDKLAGGNYKLLAGYGSTCGKEFSVKLKKPLEINNSAELSIYPGGTNISCFNGSNGFIKSNVTGGIAPYTYTWSETKNPSTVLSTKYNAENLKAGEYLLKVKDKNNCLFQETTEITQAAKVESDVDSTVVSCNSNGDGTARISSISGGTAPYTYKWSTNDTTRVIKNLAKGKYFVIVKDINSCTDTTFTEITEPDTLKVKLQITSNFSGRAISCYGKNDASIFAHVKGGSKPYKFNWLRKETTDKIDNFPNSDTLINLEFGKYYLFITDSSKCYVKDSINISQPDSLKLNLEVKNVTCYNKFNGSISTIVSGGTLPYTYTWSNNATDSSLTNITIGDYNVVVKDANKCAITRDAKITQPDILEAFNDWNSPYCPATKDGKISVEVNGGTKPYSIKWNSGQSSFKLDGLMEFDYIYTIKDSNNCELNDTIALKARHTTCLDVPTAFSPNNDGINDTWNILAGDPEHLQLLSELFPKAIVEVYNRWGDMVFKSEKGYKVEWNGKNEGKVLPMDSYYYSIDLGDGSEKWIGIISIIK